MHNKKTISKQEIEEFRQAVDSVTRLPASTIHHFKRTHNNKTSPMDIISSDAYRAYPEDVSWSKPANGHATLEFSRPGLQFKSMKALKQGKYPIQAQLDLHGYSVPEAAKLVEQFISHTQTHRQTAVLIIHGQGKRPAQKRAVLKEAVAVWLQHDPVVLAYCSAQPKDGSTGASYVLIKKKGINEK